PDRAYTAILTSSSMQYRADEKIRFFSSLLILTYTAVCYAVFKIFTITVNQWSLSTAVLGGLVGIALLLIIMSYNHPFSTNARIYFAVTPVLPAVKGPVIEVPVEGKTNRHLEAGDV